MKLRSFIMDNKYIAIKDKDLYKFLGGKLRPLDEFRKWEEKIMKDMITGEDLTGTCWTLDGGDNPRNAGRFFSIEKCIELTDDKDKKDILRNICISK